MKTKALSIIILPVLAACGSTVDPTSRSAAATAPVALNTATVIDTVGVDYDAGTSMFSFTANGAAATELAATPTKDNGTLIAFEDPGEDEYAYGYQTTNGIAAVMATDGNSGELTGVYGGLTYRRLTEATVPLTGTATLVGDYAGYLRNDVGNDDVRRTVTGDASITANFANNSVSGSVTNREVRNRQSFNIVAAEPSADMTLLTSVLDGNLAFNGNVTGGGITAAGWNVAPGTYGGLIGGPETANEAFGAVTITHTAPGATAVTEIGIFSAD